MISTEYDDLFQQAGSRYLPEWDWRWIKAECVAESGEQLDKNARSEVGAIGIAQFMPATYPGIFSAMRFPSDASPTMPIYAIPACAFYLARLRKAWFMQPRTEDDRRKLAQASYNAGLGNILRAQRFAGGAMDYETIIGSLERCTGAANSKQTRDYVTRIARYYAELTGVDENG